MKKRLSYKEALLKASSYCAYQERSQQEVRNKLYKYGLYRDEVEEAIYELITDNFINEERFAVMYAGGKFRIKRWGRRKILEGLKSHRISDYCIKKAMNAIDPIDYENTLRALIEKKNASLNNENRLKRREKVVRFVLGKGYESELVWSIVQEMIP